MRQMTEDETRTALTTFAASAINIALDCEKGTDDDHAKDFGLLVDNYFAEEPDDKGATAILVKLEDGRVYRLYVGIVPATWPEPAMDPRD
jgi:hypothetical protein